MRYNEKNSDHIGDRNIISLINDEDSLFEVSAIIFSNISGNVQANYDLTVYGDIDVSSLIVMGNFICFGNCHAKNISIQGKCTVFGTLAFEDGIFSDDIEATDIDGISIEVKGSIICKSLNYDKYLNCDGKVIVTDGIMGSGTISCDLIISGEYAAVDDDSNVFVLTDMEDRIAQMTSNSRPEKKDDSQVLQEQNIPSLDWYECNDYLKSLSEMRPEYKKDYCQYGELLEWSEMSKLSNLLQIVTLSNLLATVGELTRQSDLYHVIKKDLLEKAFEEVDEMVFPSLTQDEFAQLLYYLNKSRPIIPTNIFEQLQESLFNKIGLKYSTVKLMLEG